MKKSIFCSICLLTGLSVGATDQPTKTPQAPATPITVAAPTPIITTTPLASASTSPSTQDTDTSPTVNSDAPSTALDTGANLTPAGEKPLEVLVYTVNYSESGKTLLHMKGIAQLGSPVDFHVDGAILKTNACDMGQDRTDSYVSTGNNLIKDGAEIELTPVKIDGDHSVSTDFSVKDNHVTNWIVNQDGRCALLNTPEVKTFTKNGTLSIANKNTVAFNQNNKKLVVSVEVMK